MIDNMEEGDPRIGDLQKSIRDLAKAEKRVRLIVPNPSIRPQEKREPSDPEPEQMPE